MKKYILVQINKNEILICDGDGYKIIDVDRFQFNYS